MMEPPPGFEPGTPPLPRACFSRLWCVFSLTRLSYGGFLFFTCFCFCCLFGSGVLYFCFFVLFVFLLFVVLLFLWQGFNVVIVGLISKLLVLFS